MQESRRKNKPMTPPRTPGQVAETMRCPSCLGSGEWETACCNGAGGCDCRGELVPMGTCNVCQGCGRVPADISKEQLRANVRSIQGLCFIGRGPTSGMWATMGTRGYRRI
jgi:hypothetical protein